MKNENHNGWHNYETWLVKLWMDNSEGQHGFYCENAQSAFDNALASETFTKSQQAALDLSASLKEEFEEGEAEILKGLECSVWADLLGSALGEVNWREIAESLLADVEYEEKEEA